MQCPACGCPTMTHGTRDELVRYRGHEVTVSCLSGHRCTDCDETVFDPACYDRYREASDGLIASTHRRADPDLRRIRKKLRLTQAEAGRLFGGGTRAFSCYERGESAPPVALALLLSLLDRHPELLEELRRGM